MKNTVEVRKNYLSRGGRCALYPRNFYLKCRDGR